MKGDQCNVLVTLLGETSKRHVTFYIEAEKRQTMQRAATLSIFYFITVNMSMNLNCLTFY